MPTDMLKRRLKQADCQRTIRLTYFVQPVSRIFSRNDGTLEAAQRIAGHADSRTTKLYDRTKDEITLSEVERILRVPYRMTSPLPAFPRPHFVTE
jgi:hypothetical protein